LVFRGSDAIGLAVVDGEAPSAKDRAGVERHGSSRRVSMAASVAWAVGGGQIGRDGGPGMSEAELEPLIEVCRKPLGSILTERLVPTLLK
jgi:hypothetical protein